MSRTLTYADAARLLDGGRSPLVTALDNLTGGVLLGAAVAAPAVLGLFDAKAEFIRLSHELVGKLAERRAGLSRYGRTERLAAAHRVLVVTAYFEALAEADLPFRFTDLELTEREQVTLTGAGHPDQSLLASLFAEGVPTPGPQQPYESFRASLDEYYTAVTEGLTTFVTGLSVWERLDGFRRASGAAALHGVPARAVRRHQELFGRLADEFPEVAFWTGLREHAGTRAEVRRVATALADLEQFLREASAGRISDQHRSGLARAYAVELDGSVVESGDVPAGIRMPSLGTGYVPPLCRVAELGPAARPSEESWWAGRQVRDDLSEFLTGYLTNPAAVEAPLLVLGQPGSGKSVLTRVLAARLPQDDFLPVRVVLRDVPAAAELQDQLEYAVRATTGERLDWPALVRSAGDALPVVLLDGFDELLQATGVSQTDYLLKVARFQRREAAQGRPVVVVVTSRTSVADRARAPEGTVAIRLEPFDEARIAVWLAIWNAVNADEFTARGVTPLDLPTVLAYRELAGQPLLLLMLALYDADDNALRSAGALRQDQLYERLLRRFAGREVEKHRPGLPDRELDRAVEQELRRLSVVAFAMFNRSTQWVTEAELDVDLAALFGSTPVPGTGTELRASLRHAEIVLGRFFFVHRSRALRDDERLETYEFLHATFGEFLVARFTWQVLTDIAAREAAASMSLGGGSVDDDLLHALLSYAALSGRAPILGFLQALMAGAADELRADLTELLVRLFRAAHHTRPARRFDAYQPRGLPVPTRHAAYSVNLLLLAVCAAGTLHGGRLYPDRNVVPVWHRETLLWQSQLSSEDWTSLVATLALDRLRTEDGERDITLRIVTDPVEASPVDPRWTYAVRPGSVRTVQNPAHSFAHLRREAYLRCGLGDDLLLHALEPLADVLPSAVNTISLDSGTSVAHALARLVTISSSPDGSGRRQAAYLRCHSMLDGLDSVAEQHQFRTLLLNRLAVDPEMPAILAAELITGAAVRDGVAVNAAWLDGVVPSRLIIAVLQCGLLFLGRDPEADRIIAPVLSNLAHGSALAPANRHLLAEVISRLGELGWLPRRRPGPRGARDDTAVAAD
ncbi:NACHT domain-containing protein [Plantactinospora sonchi]|uniref:NACHT N-terminal Helical domain-containing protein n=1 Tax=Plantactinospora sonchi TaxID=1544735 RepID=A0ABU7S0B0_9ACTN